MNPFRKRNQEIEERKKREEFFAKELQSIRESIGKSQSELSGQMKELGERMEELGNRADYRQITKHAMALEDMLEYLQDKHEKDDWIHTNVRALEKRESSLLTLIHIYMEHMHAIMGYMEQQGVMDDSFTKQIQIIESKTEQAMRTCAIRPITGVGERVNYEYHEAIEAVDTNREELSTVIAKVYVPGFLFHGEVKKKAKVGVYRYKEAETADVGVSDDIEQEEGEGACENNNWY